MQCKVCQSEYDPHEVARTYGENVANANCCKDYCYQNQTCRRKFDTPLQSCRRKFEKLMTRIDDEPDEELKKKKAMMFDRKLDEVGFALNGKLENMEISDGTPPDIQTM